MWKIRVPSRLHIFVLLLPNNKTLTRDNLAKRQQVDDDLFFSCCVAQCMWQVAPDIMGVNKVHDFEGMAKI
jgi:hypothetical protein